VALTNEFRDVTSSNGLEVEWFLNVCYCIIVNVRSRDLKTM